VTIHHQPPNQANPGDAVRLGVLAALRDAVSGSYNQARKGLAASMEPGDRKTIRLPDGTKLGAASLTEGRLSAKVTDNQALLSWVAANHPDELVQAIRESFLRKLLDDAKKHGAAVDVTSGEFIPGITVEDGDPYLTYRPLPDAGQIVASRWRELAGLALPELTEGL